MLEAHHAARSPSSSVRWTGGGAQRDMILLANAMAARGRSVEILTLVPKGPLRPLVERDVTLVEVAGRQLRTAWAGLRRTLAARRPEVIVSAEAASNLLTIAAARSLPGGTRPRMILREVSSPSVSQSLDPYRQTRWAYGALRWLYRHADVVVALTEGARRDLAENFGVPPRKLVLMTSNAVIDERQAEIPTAERARVPGLVVAVGRLIPRKGSGDSRQGFRGLAPRHGGQARDLRHRPVAARPRPACRRPRSSGPCFAHGLRARPVPGVPAGPPWPCRRPVTKASAT